MEPASMAISVVSLASLFQTAIDSFQYIQLSKNFGSDFQTSCLLLDNAHLRLSRWGEAIGLSEKLDEIASLRIDATSQDMQRAEALLGHIINLFLRAEKVSSKFRAEGGDGEVVDIQDVLESQNVPLHQRMRDICIRRQKHTSYQQKAKWALYEKQHLEELIDRLRNLVSELIDLFPAAAPAQKQLCEQEASELRNEAALQTLKEIAGKQDKPLEEAIARLAASEAKTTHNEWINNGNAKVVNQGENMNFYGGQTVHF